MREYCPMIGLLHETLTVKLVVASILIIDPRNFATDLTTIFQWSCYPESMALHAVSLPLLQKGLLFGHAHYVSNADGQDHNPPSWSLISCIVWHREPMQEEDLPLLGGRPILLTIHAKRNTVRNSVLPSCCGGGLTPTMTDWQVSCPAWKIKWCVL
jgi:hypothetical protein